MIGKNARFFPILGVLSPEFWQQNALPEAFPAG
jgi:hypothetical protein